MAENSFEEIYGVLKALWNGYEVPNPHTVLGVTGNLHEALHILDPLSGHRVGVIVCKRHSFATNSHDGILQYMLVSGQAFMMSEPTETVIGKLWLLSPGIFFCSSIFPECAGLVRKNTS